MSKIFNASAVFISPIRELSVSEIELVSGGTFEVDNSVDPGCPGKNHGGVDNHSKCMSH